MSIWVSRHAVGYDEVAEEPVPVGGEVRSYCEGWSNHYPTTDGDAERPASIDTAHVPDFCVPGHQDDNGNLVGPWLRLTIWTQQHNWHAPSTVAGPKDASVVMDEDAVRALVADLTAWLDHERVYPS